MLPNLQIQRDFVTIAYLTMFFLMPTVICRFNWKLILFY